jgi:hypothetical protein
MYFTSLVLVLVSDLCTLPSSSSSSPPRTHSPLQLLGPDGPVPHNTTTTNTSPQLNLQARPDLPTSPTTKTTSPPTPPTHPPTTSSHGKTQSHSHTTGYYFNNSTITVVSYVVCDLRHFQTNHKPNPFPIQTSCTPLDRSPVEHGTAPAFPT